MCNFFWTYIYTFRSLTDPTLLRNLKVAVETSISCPMLPMCHENCLLTTRDEPHPGWSLPGPTCCYPGANTTFLQLALQVMSHMIMSFDGSSVDSLQAPNISFNLEPLLGCDEGLPVLPAD